MEIEYLCIDGNVLCYMAFAFAITMITKMYLSRNNGKKGKK